LQRRKGNPWARGREKGGILKWIMDREERMELGIRH